MIDGSDVLSGYAEDAKDLIARYDTLLSEEVLAPVLDLLPKRPVRVLDVGAGTGRDAAWLAGQGHEVTAAEPVDAFRSAGRALHPVPNLNWSDDRLPCLHNLTRSEHRYDLILVVAVWQHLRPEEQVTAISTLASLAAPGGRIILSLRHGPGAPTRPCYPCSPEEIIQAAQDERLKLAARRESTSLQQRNRDAGVTWTWLCFDAPP